MKYQEFKDKYPHLNWEEAELVPDEDLEAAADYFGRHQFSGFIKKYLVIEIHRQHEPDFEKAMEISGTAYLKDTNQYVVDQYTLGNYDEEEKEEFPRYEIWEDYQSHGEHEEPICFFDTLAEMVKYLQIDEPKIALMIEV